MSLVLLHEHEPRFVALEMVTAFAPLVPGVEEVRKGVVRRQHWMMVRLLTVMRAGAVR